MPTLAQVVLDAERSGADPVAVLQEYVEEKDDLHVTKNWCGRFVQDVLAEQRQAGKPVLPREALDDYLDADFEDRVFGAGG